MRTKKVDRKRLSWGGVVLGLSLLGAMGFGCQQGATASTGGETHFLRLCDPDSDPCSQDFACICGVCTNDCSVEEPCSNLPGAQCVLPTRSCEEPPTHACDVHCTANEDCRALSAEHNCIDGWCRLASDHSVPSAGGASGAPPDPECEPTGINANEVVVLGDSFFATTHQVTGYLEERARSAGAVSAGERYRDYSNLIDNALAFGSPGITAQYETASDESTVRVVIMNGGGADVLLGTCDPVDASCPVIADAVLELSNLLGQMATDGLDDLVFVSYPDPIPNEVFEKMEVLRPLLQAECSASVVPCHFVDLQSVFVGNESEYIEPDGLNPTRAGSEAAAAAIWQVMEEDCVAQ